ncbi:MAG: nucleotidyltransferase domain-containing protein [Pseudomonadota bacterium]
MRLSAQHAQRIKEESRAVFGPHVQVRLFGSRVDDRARGGDIDLLITAAEPLDRPAQLASRLGARLQMALGEQRIDIVLEAPNLLPLPIHRVAHEQGVLL